MTRQRGKLEWGNEVLAGQNRTPAVIPGATPPRPRLGRGRRIYFSWCASKPHESSSTKVLSTRCIFAGHVLVISLFVSFCLVVAAFVLPVYDKYPCEVPGILWSGQSVHSCNERQRRQLWSYVCEQKEHRISVLISVHSDRHSFLPRKVSIQIDSHMDCSGTWQPYPKTSKNTSFQNRTSNRTILQKDWLKRLKC